MVRVPVHETAPYLCDFAPEIEFRGFYGYALIADRQRLEAELRSEIGKLSCENAELRVERTKLRKENAELRGENSGLQLKNEHAQIEVQSLRDVIEHLGRERQW